MSVFFALLAGAGTIAGFIAGYDVGTSRGYREGYSEGRAAMRATFERAVSLARLELLARDTFGSGSELADLVMALLRESD